MPVTLPTHQDTEKLVLGCCLLGRGHMDDIRGRLSAADFSTESHRRIYVTACELYDAGIEVDYVTVAQSLQDKGQLDNVGGLSSLVDLTNGLPDIPSIDRYVDRVLDAALRRSMIFTAQKLAIRAADLAESASDVLAAFASASADLTSGNAFGNRPVSTHDLLSKQGVEAMLSPRMRGSVRLPWNKLDRDLGGLSGGQMVVLMAATSRGKTSMALQIATAAAAQGHTPLIWTMEMSAKSMFARMVTQLSGVWSGKRTMTLQERDSQGLALTELDEHPIYFDSFSRSVGSFIASMRQVRSRSTLGVGIVDYLQLIRATGARSRAQEVSDNSRQLKLAAMDLNVPLVVLSQVDRTSVKGDAAKIGLHSAKESGDVENDADVMMWIEGSELSRDADSLVSLHIGKQREGPAGFSIPMVFRPQSQVFLEVDQ